MTQTAPTSPTDKPESPLQHLTEQQLESLADELDAIRDRAFAELGDRDRRYIESMIEMQRRLAVIGRVLLLAAANRPARLGGTAALSAAKILENMEIGHNVLHGQWDWMNDPDINSTTWDWDTASTAEAWKHSHNYVHHTYTNIRGKDKDLGYEIMRIDPEQHWHPVYLLQPFYNLILAAFFEWGVALHDLDFEAIRKGRKSKAAAANASANAVRNVWAYAIIFCGHFPDQTYTFSPEEVVDESRGGWYVRQMVGAANIEGSPLFHVASGNLSFQVEHHLFPDLPSSRYAEIAPQVKDVCERYGLPYNTGPFWQQFGMVQRTILRLAFPGGEPRPKPGPYRAPRSDL